MITSEICPYLKECPIYKNWVEQTKDERLNIILYCDGIGYSCTALRALEKPASEDGILFNDELKKRIKKVNMQKNIGRIEIKCSHISLLNLLTKK